MACHLARSLVFVCACLWLLGCQHAVKIEAPTAGVHSEPVTQFRVKFHNKFQPGSFKAYLSGKTITYLFQPTPAPNGVSFASITDPDYMDWHYPGQNRNKQLLRVEADFVPGSQPAGISSWVRYDEAEFTPPGVQIFRGNTTSYDLTLQERQTIVATVFVKDVPKEALTVRVTGHPAVSLNEQPAGQDIFVTIPRNDRRADFSIRGIVTGGEGFRIRPIANGYASRASGGTVKAVP